MNSLKCTQCKKLSPVFNIQHNHKQIALCSKRCETLFIQSNMSDTDLITIKYVNLNEYDIDKDSLGRGTWTLLHAIANNYPDEPDQYHKEVTSKHLYYLAEVYPCSKCRPHFRQMVESEEIDYSSKEALKKSITKLHNIVNRRLCKKEINY